MDEIKGGGGEELYAIATKGNIEKDLEPNLDQVIDNIQVEHVESIELVVLIGKPTQLVITVIESSQHVQLVIEHIQIENP